MKAKFPELLAPAGSPAALDAAIESGADAVYLGASTFNARMNAKNFSAEELKSGIGRAHAFGVSVYLTMNTLVTDRELPLFLEAAREAYESGVDALIIADPGAARAVHRLLPEFPLHASTQMSGHNTDMGRILSEAGYTRMVLARETPEADIRSFCASSPIEAEVFLHGALCVSTSGQCLFSSVVGGRSGNRGECAQPCRLSYNGGYPLSLRDLCLARQIPALIEMGVASLKIEGRMKSPEYVRDVTAIYRRLLDERRGARDGEIAELAAIFSRGGFTDGYFTQKLDGGMLGVRSERDKETTRTLLPFQGLQRRAPVDLSVKLRAGEPALLTVMRGGESYTALGKIPEPAERAPLTKESVEKQITRLGGTVYTAGQVDIDLGEGLMLPVSALNALRRDAIAKLAARDAKALVLRSEVPAAFAYRSPFGAEDPKSAFPERSAEFRTARFTSAGQITRRASEWFQIRYLPLFVYLGGAGREDAMAARAANGVILPPVIFDRDREKVKQALRTAVENGAEHLLLSNPGQIPLIRELFGNPVRGVTLHGDFRLNLTNRESVGVYTDLGCSDLLLSPELTLPQARDIGTAAGVTEVLVYGRIPLMLLEKCLNLTSEKIAHRAACKACDACRQNHGMGKDSVPNLTLTDRRNAVFPVLREWEHRNVLYNSLPTYMADRLALLRENRLFRHHYLFSTESPEEVDRVIEAYRAGSAPTFPVRRWK